MEPVTENAMQAYFIKAAIQTTSWSSKIPSNAGNSAKITRRNHEQLWPLRQKVYIAITIQNWVCLQAVQKWD